MSASSPDRKRIIGAVVTGRTTRWRAVSEQQIYSMKLIQALRRVRSRNRTRVRADPCFTFRETADRLLASAAGGRTRWSRAILSNRLRGSMMNRRHKKVSRVSREIRRKKKMKMMMTMPLLLPSLIRRKTQLLRDLVPGCRNLSFSSLIEEASDYIAALEMQVRAMSAIAGVLNGRGAGAGSSPADSEMARI